MKGKSYRFECSSEQMEFLLRLAVGSVIAADLRGPVDASHRLLLDTLVREGEVSHEVGASIRILPVEWDGVDAVAMIACDDVGEHGPMAGLFTMAEVRQVALSEMARPEHGQDCERAAALRQLIELMPRG
ncbi:MAG: hypothetical protein KDG55_05805 [Rhodocyclaceae bacterium]|nr:hypothetical protein [Rhodocyclaceae bacterium]